MIIKGSSRSKSAIKKKKPFQSQKKPAAAISNKPDPAEKNKKEQEGAVIKNKAWRKQQEDKIVARLVRCDNRRLVEDLRQLHSWVEKIGFGDNVVVANTLMRMYSKCGSLEESRRVFQRLSADKRNARTWNTLILACVQNGDCLGASKIFQAMPRSMLNPVAANVMIVAYGKSKAVHEAKSVFDGMWGRDDWTWCSLISAYISGGHSRDAAQIFRRMPSQGSVACTSMLAVCAQNGHIGEAWNLFLEMKQRDVYTYSSLISLFNRQGMVPEMRQVFNKMPLRNNYAWTTAIAAYAKTGHFDEARNLFDRMPEPDVVTWTSLMTAYAQSGFSREALEMFKLMDLQGIEADRFTFSIIVDACASLSDAAEGTNLHKAILESGHHDVVVGNSLINMYGKCGNVDAAVAVFENLPDRVIATWNSLIAAYTENGWHQAAFRTFGKLNLDGSVQPDGITFTGMFTACSHTGKLGAARDFFLAMSRDFSITPLRDHYACMSDLLARVGRLADGEELLNTMPYDPHPVAWMALMGSCRTHLNADIAERAAEYVYRFDPECPAPYILLSNIYAALGRTKDLLRIRKLMKSRGVKNRKAFSYIQVKDKMLPFAVADWTRRFYVQHCKRSVRGA